MWRHSLTEGEMLPCTYSYVPVHLYVLVRTSTFVRTRANKYVRTYLYVHHCTTSQPSHENFFIKNIKNKTSIRSENTVLSCFVCFLQSEMTDHKYTVFLCVFVISCVFPTIRDETHTALCTKLHNLTGNFLRFAQALLFSHGIKYDFRELFLSNL